MNSFMPVKLYTGAGCVKKQAQEFKKLGKKALVVTGRYSARACGALQDVTDVLEGFGISFVLFDEIGQNPELTDCMRAGELAHANACDFIIGIGGGSPMDAAKCIAVLAANPGMTQPELYSLVWKEKPLPVAVVGTTAGTGSEVTKVSVITTPEGRKKSFHHEAVFPVVAFGDPCYTRFLPETVTSSTSIDALAHATESYFSRNANEISQSYSVRALQLLLPQLRKIAEGKAAELSYEDREDLYHASIYGGLAINITGTCLPHAMGYLLTEQHQIPHGNACAVFLPDFMQINEMEKPMLTDQFFRTISCEKETFLALIAQLLREVHVEITEDEIQREHARWIDNSSIQKGWGEISADTCDEILRRIGKRSPDVSWRAFQMRGSGRSTGENRENHTPRTFD